MPARHPRERGVPRSDRHAGSSVLDGARGRQSGVRANIPMGRVGRADEVASAVVLSSPPTTPPTSPAPHSSSTAGSPPHGPGELHARLHRSGLETIGRAPSRLRVATPRSEVPPSSRARVRRAAPRLDPRLDHGGGFLRVVDVLFAAPESVARVVELRPGRELEGRAARIGRMWQAVLALEDDEALFGSKTTSRSGRSSSGRVPSRRRSSRRSPGARGTLRRRARRSGRPREERCPTPPVARRDGALADIAVVGEGQLEFCTRHVGRHAAPHVAASVGSPTHDAADRVVVAPGTDGFQPGGREAPRGEPRTEKAVAILRRALTPSQPEDPLHESRILRRPEVRPAECARLPGEERRPRGLRKVLETPAASSDPTLWKGVAEMGWLARRSPRITAAPASAISKLVLIAEEIGSAAVAPDSVLGSVYLATEAILRSAARSRRSAGCRGSRRAM